MNLRLEIVTVAIRDDGCFSVLKWDGRPFAVSVERTFEDRRVVVPAGILRCERSFFHHGGYATFEILVTGHDHVLFHKGNREADSLACLCVAESFGEIGGQTAVIDSKGGFNEFMQLTAGLESFDVLVRGR